MFCLNHAWDAEQVGIHSETAKCPSTKKILALSGADFVLPAAVGTVSFNYFSLRCLVSSRLRFGLTAYFDWKCSGCAYPCYGTNVVCSELW